MRRAKLGVGLLLLAGIALPVLAQESILPPGFGDPAPPPPPPVQQPQQTQPAPTSRPVAAPREQSATEASGDALAEAPVAAQPEYVKAARRDWNQAGLFPPQSLGLGVHPWGSAHGKFLSILLRRMDTPLASRWGHIVLRSALLAKSDAPIGVHPADWAAERAWLLLRMGEADAARMLVATIDTDRFTPKMVQVATQAALATGDPSALCPIEGQIEKAEPRIAPMVSAICASLSGASEQAASQIERVRRRGALPPIDISLADKLIGAAADSNRAVTIEWEPVERLDSWRYGLSTATGMMPPQKLIDAARPQLRAWLARSPIFPPEQKLAAARTAATLGVMSSAAFVGLQSAIFDATDPDSLGGTDAWQLRLAYAAADADDRMIALRTLWTSGDGKEPYAALVLTARAASLVQPNAKLSADVPNLIASMLAGGFDRQAAHWAPMLGDLAEGDGDRAWAMLALAAPATRGIDLRLTRIEDFAERDSSEGKRRTALLVGALAGLGRIDAATADRISREHALGLGGKTRWSGYVDGAAARGQAGTAVILAASGLQAPSPDRMEGFYLFHAVAALRKVGLDYAARMVAAEALARS